jgi:hypothetical protein
LIFKHVPLETLLPKRMQGVVEGEISGQFKLRGSTNSNDGIGFEGRVVLEDGDTIVLRDRLYLLRALQVVDGGVNGFRKVVFREGSFDMSSLAGMMEVRNADLKADEAMTLQGRLLVRPPTQEEVDAALAGRRAEGDLAPLFAKESVADEEAIVPKSQGSDVTLKKAALAQNRTDRDKKSETAGDGDFFEHFEFLDNSRQMQLRAAELLQRNLQYEGGFRITLPASAFVRAPELRDQYPPDTTTGRISLDVPVKGGLDEITLTQAEELYEKGRRRD